MSKKRYILTIEPLTGVHIGTGAELTLLDYKLQQLANKKKMYLKFSSDSILNRLISEGKDLTPFYMASDNRNMKAMQEFFHGHVSKTDIEYPCDVTREFSQTYARNKIKDPLDNAAFVLQMYRPAGSNRPVIPGSSLKGAIRTAVLNDIISKLSDAEFDKHENRFQQEKEKAKFEKILQKAVLKFNNEKNDPFRTVLIEDAAFLPKNTQLVGLMKNISTQADGELTAISMQIQAEIIRGTLIDGEARTITTITIDTPLQGTILPSQEHGKRPFDFRHKISMEDIADACNYFFMNEFEKEYATFYKQAVDSTGILTKLKLELKKICDTENSFIIRVGRWSQVEFVTFEEIFRKPTGKSGTTRMVFDYDGEYVPLGWCKCTYVKQ